MIIINDLNGNPAYAIDSDKALNLFLLKYEDAGIVQRGKNVGAKKEAGWKDLGRYPSNLPFACRSILDMFAIDCIEPEENFEHYANKIENMYNALFEIASEEDQHSRNM